jgi:hypothetical protein
MRLCCYGLACALVCLQASCARAAGPLLPFKKAEPAPFPPGIPWQELTEQGREQVLAVIDKPTLAARGPADTFPCNPEQYLWFLDHPDRAVTAWQRLGAKCVTITPRGDGRFAPAR